MSEPTEHDIRYSRQEDLSYLETWLQDPEDLQYYPWSQGKELSLGAKNWIGFSRFKCSLTATIEEKPCGIATLFLMPYQKVCHNSFFYMIVGKEYRRKKIGTSLLKNLKNLGHKYFNLEGIHAEIFSHCPIIPLLEKQGFTPIFTQEKFVKIEKKYLSRTLYECLF